MPEFPRDSHVMRTVKVNMVRVGLSQFDLACRIVRRRSLGYRPSDVWPVDCALEEFFQLGICTDELLADISRAVGLLIPFNEWGAAALKRDVQTALECTSVHFFADRIQFAWKCQLKLHSTEFRRIGGMLLRDDTPDDFFQGDFERAFNGMVFDCTRALWAVCNIGTVATPVGTS